jgi:hypothetical protein
MVATSNSSLTTVCPVQLSRKLYAMLLRFLEGDRLALRLTELDRRLGGCKEGLSGLRGVRVNADIVEVARMSRPSPGVDSRSSRSCRMRRENMRDEGITPADSLPRGESVVRPCLLSVRRRSEATP